MTVTQLDHGHLLTTKSRIITIEQRRRPENEAELNRLAVSSRTAERSTCLDVLFDTVHTAGNNVGVCGVAGLAAKCGRLTM